MQTLDSILAGEEAPVEQAEEMEAPEAEAEESGEAAETEEAEAPAEPEAAEPEKESKDERVPIVALLDEREKRQQASREAEELRKRLEAYEKQQANPDAELPDMFEDPQGYTKALQEHFNRQLQEREQKFQTQLEQYRIAAAEQSARARYSDFQEKVDFFIQAANETPLLAAQMQQAPDPAEYAYQTATQMMQLREVGDAAALRERIRQEVREELERERAEAENKRKSVPPSLSTEQNAAPGQRQAWAPASLDEILKR